jgi:ABC-type sugar transport system substrate-binding protein
MNRARLLVSMMLVVLLFAPMVVFAGGGGETQAAGAGKGPDARFTYEKLASMSEARKYVGEPAKGFKLAYGHVMATEALSQTVLKGIKEEWALAGGDPEAILVVDNQLNSQKALENADIVFSQKVNAFAEFQVDALVNAQIGRRAKDSGVHMVGIEVPIPGFPFAGTDNYGDAVLMGKWLVDNIEKKYGGWDKVDVVFVQWHPNSGDAVKMRTIGSANVLEQKYGASAKLDAKGSKVVSVNSPGTTEGSKTATIDALSAYPNAKNIIVMTMGSFAAQGTVQGAKLVNRFDPNTWMVTAQALDPVGVELITNGEVTASVNFHFDWYGRYIVTGLLALLNGNSCPPYLFVKSEIVTKENVAGFKM